jgi:hypothetical protein
VNFTWPADTVTLSHPTLPKSVTQHCVYKFENITDNDPGSLMRFGPASELNWKDHKTLQWGSEGPGDDVTVRVTYLASGEELASDDQVPDLIPAQLHELLVLSAAVYLRWKADEEAPRAWLSELHEMRLDFWKLVSRERPLTDGAPGEELGGLHFTVNVEV